MEEEKKTEGKIIAERREKLALVRTGGAAYPNDFRRENYAGDLLSQYGQVSAQELSDTPIKVKVAGRLMLKRDMGRAAFGVLQDVSGRIQLYVSADHAGEDILGSFKGLDLGDILGCTGHLFFTKKGELTVRAEELQLLAKALRPLPEKYHGLADKELRYRRRYVSLISDPKEREVFRTRNKLLRLLRERLEREGYMEVETPMMHPIPGGATARPFVTHHNALSQDLYLRVAPELYLKRLLVGGLEKVFEINRNFRNEGLSPQHNPEFTMLEFYSAYERHTDFMLFTESLLGELAQQIVGSHNVEWQGHRLDFSAPFDRLTLVEAIVKHNPSYSEKQVQDVEFLRRELKRLDGMKAKQLATADDLGGMQMAMFEKTCEDNILQPTFVMDYPTSVSPLSRPCDNNPDIAERFELFIGGREIANGFSELNDPEKQSEVFRSQASKFDAGEMEAMHYDQDYICALEHGMPPAAGEGIGVDRLTMLFADAFSIRDVILFPQLKERQ